MYKVKFGIGLGLLLVAAAGQAAVAAPVYWTPSSGSNAVLTYSDGQSDNGLFGNPIVTGSTFTFVPANFEADAPKANGTNGSTVTDRVSFKAATATTGTFNTVTVHEFGDYSILGAGGAVKVTGALFLTDLTGSKPVTLAGATPKVVYTNTDTNTSSSTAPRGDSDGLFAVDYVYTLPAGVKSLQLVLNNNLQAVALSGSTSTIQKKGVTISFNDPTVPEPAAIGVLALGGLVVGRRRRVPVA